MSFQLYDLPGHDEPQLLSDEQVELMAEKPQRYEPTTQDEAVRAAALNPDFDPIKTVEGNEVDENGGAYQPDKHTIADVLEYVDGDPATAAMISSLERARGEKARPKLLEALTAVAEGQ